MPSYLVAVVVGVTLVVPSGMAWAQPHGTTVAEQVPADPPLGKRLKQRLANPSLVARRVRPIGSTRLVRRALRTNAGRRVRVSVRVSDATGLVGRRVRAKSHSRIRKNKRGRVGLWLSGSDGVKVTIRLRAKGTRHYRPMRKSRTFYTVPVPSRTLGGIGMDFLGGILGGVGHQIGEKLGGWAMGALFGTDGEDPKILQILDELNAIQGQLNSIESEIGALRAELKDAVCTITTSGLAAQIGEIDAAVTEYQGLIRNHDTGAKELLAWADYYQTNIKVALSQINAAMMGTAAPGTIENCATSIRQRWTQPLAESSYYQAVYQYLGYFYQYQVQGLNLVVEAEHLRAAVAAGPTALPTDPSQVQKICITPPNADVKTACDKAATWASQVYNNLVAQAVKAGAGYSWNTTFGPNLAVQGGTPRLWATNLNSFGDTSGCSKPLNSAPTPCGPTVGGTNPLPPGLGYAGWGIAGQDDWFSILAGHGTKNDTYAGLMDASGFTPGKNQRMIVYTGETVDGRTDPNMQWNFGDADSDFNPRTPAPIVAMCFLDTKVAANVWDLPLCTKSKTRFSATLNSARWNSWKHGSTDVWFTLSDQASRTDQVSNPEWYGGQLHAAVRFQPPDGKRLDSFNVDNAPNWLAIGPHGATGNQYRWPMIDLSKSVITCKPLVVNGVTYPLTPTQAGGAYTMCGDDFQSWLWTWVPRYPT